MFLEFLRRWLPRASKDSTAIALSLAVRTDDSLAGFEWAAAEKEIAKWWWFQRNEATDWAIREHIIASDNDLPRLPRPKFFPKEWK